MHGERRVIAIMSARLGAKPVVAGRASDAEDPAHQPNQPGAFLRMGEPVASHRATRLEETMGNAFGRLGDPEASR